MNGENKTHNVLDYFQCKKKLNMLDCWVVSAFKGSRAFLRETSLPLWHVDRVFGTALCGSVGAEMMLSWYLLCVCGSDLLAV